MNRIYQGRVSGAEFVNQEGAFEPLKDWKRLLWQHHELFQDAVNYYTLALAAMARHGQDFDPKQSIVRQWAKQVEDSWQEARKRGFIFEGPHKNISDILNLVPQNTAFDECANKILQNCKATPAAQTNALIQLLEEADARDLNQTCVTRLPFLCTPKGQLNATPTDVQAQQRQKKQTLVVKIHGSNEAKLNELAKEVDPGLFLTQYPQSQNVLTPSQTIKMVSGKFDSLIRKNPSWISLKTKFLSSLQQLAATRPLLRPGRRPTGSYPYAVVFRYFPDPVTWRALKQVTQADFTRAQNSTKTASGSTDHIHALRINDNPPFDYFSNMAMVRAKGDKNRAVWFEFDLAAFIEAIMSPHRFYQDTMKRRQEAELLCNKIKSMEDNGTNPGHVVSEEDDDVETKFGFKDDLRIKLIRELVTDTLGFLAESDDPTLTTTEYSISERTLRGFDVICKKWKKLTEKGAPSEAELFAVIASEQADHRNDFGSATLYRELAKPKFWPIWRDSGTEPWHTDNPLEAWRQYKELQYELSDKKRAIRYTPAHPSRSPRFFDFPKQGRYRAQHVSNTGGGNLQFDGTIVLKTDKGFEPTSLRFSYASPRLKRDRIRDKGEENLHSMPWIQPMVAALSPGEHDMVDFANTRISLMPASEDNIQLGFPVQVDPKHLHECVQQQQQMKWNRQFNFGKDTITSLRWPTETRPRNAPENDWWEITDSFSCLAIDLGQRTAGAFARLEVTTGQNGSHGRFLGNSRTKDWFARVKRQGLLRLPGEDVKVWRKESADGKQQDFKFREELFGRKGRSATQKETEDTLRLLGAFFIDEKEFMSPNWRSSLSFPEQNDKLLVAARRAQSRIARLHRWAWFLEYAEKQDQAFGEILECEDLTLVPDTWKILAKQKNLNLKTSIRELLTTKLASLPKSLVDLANRVVPLKQQSWHWHAHPMKNDCYILDQTGPFVAGVKIRGQRGLSMERVEQISELRKRFQSLNQTLRREIGKKAPIRRDDSIPDCCPDLLEKLDALKEQRVNQTAHLVMAEALGLRLKTPAPDKKQLKKECDVHGQYEPFDKPVDFIVIEDLSRYRTSQGRARRENSRLMKWCHRAVRDKLKQLCEVFFPSCGRMRTDTGFVELPPLLETPAAYSSRFCSRSGVAGFRAIEVGPGFENTAPWIWLKNKKDADGQPTEDAQLIAEIINLLAKTTSSPHSKPTTLVVPLAGGPIFVPLSFDKPGTNGVLVPKMVQADINAALNLGLRAVASPNEWSIHSRLRSLLEDGRRCVREKRKFRDQNPGIQSDETDRHANFFADFSCLVGWGHAQLTCPEGTIPPPVRLVSGKALWSTVNKSQWDVCMKINHNRLNKK